MQNKTRENITFIGGLLGSLVALLTILEKTSYLEKAVPIHNSIAFTDIINLVILIFFYFSLKPKNLTLDNSEEMIELAKRLDIEDQNYTLLRFNNDRVNKLIGQISTTLSWFIGILILFYLINLLKDVDPATYVKWNAPFPFMDFFDTLTNGVSAAFIYLTFVILYNTTLDANNRSSNFYKGTLFFMLVFFGTYLILLTSPNVNKTTVSNIFKLLCGIYNGLAMGLLFGRIASMEFYFKNLNSANSESYKNTYQFGVTFILPLYVLAQPMYGIMEFTEFQSPHFKDLFKAIVFLVCFIGKGFFLLFITNRINNRWLHAYLHLSLSNHKRSESVITTISKNQFSSEPGETALSPFLLNIDGEYEYVCVQRGVVHSHGGTCIIEQVSNSENALEWKLVGARKWTKDGGDEAIIYDQPYQWETQKGVIFKDKSYMYVYHINLENDGLSGISRGNIIFSANNKEILEFHGIYYQQAGNEIVWGAEHFKKILRRRADLTISSGN
jgi:hypothetical protein